MLKKFRCPIKQLKRRLNLLLSTLVILLFIIASLIGLHKVPTVTIHLQEVHRQDFGNQRDNGVIKFDPIDSPSSSNKIDKYDPLEHQVTLLKRCPVVSPYLNGSHQPDIDRLQRSTLSWKDIEKRNDEVEPGGHHQPRNCIARHDVAIIVPFRNRENNLKIFSAYLNKFLQRQQLNYTIFVVEQLDNYPFNRGALFNIGFIESTKMYNFGCYALHDVDLLPENDKNLYICDKKYPIHMTAFIRKYNYTLLYEQYFGGACLLTSSQLIKMNGFSNLYWGWGGEDDDFYNRLVAVGFRRKRYSSDIAKYTMLKHGPGKVNPFRFQLLLKAIKNYRTDGLNNIKYDLLKVTKRKLYTLIQVKLKVIEKFSVKNNVDN
ncbi:B4GALT3 (predicted) [Pycnogonum litorale]